MRPWGVLAATALLFLPGPRAALSAPAPTEPAWLRRPGPEVIARIYPRTALALGIEGRAQLACKVLEIGLLAGCRVIDEAPADLGFGGAAMRLTASYRTLPPADGGEVLVRVAFRPPPEPASPALPPVTSASALRLALRLVDQRKVMDRIEARLEVGAQAVETTEERGVPPGVRAAAAQALRAARAARREETRQSYARLLVEVFSEAELAELAAYPDSAAAALARPTPAFRALLGRMQDEAVRRQSADARADFCQAWPCPTAETALTAVERGQDAAIAFPEWSHAPSPQEVVQALPRIAWALGLEGAARLGCVIGPEGEPTSCQVAAEAPVGLGFGSAALSLAGSFRLAPELMAAGAAGRTATVRLAFKAPQRTGPFEVPDPPSARAMYLAQAYVGADGMGSAGQQLLASILESLVRLRPQELAGVDPRLRDGAEEALARARKGAVAAYGAQLSRAFALSYPEEVLAAGVAFRKGPAYRAEVARLASLDAADRTIADWYATVVRTDAKAAFCSTHGCAPDPVVALAPAAAPGPPAGSPAH